MRAFLVLTLAVLLAAPTLAAAQKPRPAAPAAPRVPRPPRPPAPPGPPLPPTNESHTAAADRLIARTNGAENHFVNATPPAGPATVVHRRSGLVCVFPPPAVGQIQIYATPQNGSPGDDIGCNAVDGVYLRTFYATRYGDGTFDSHFEVAVRQMRARYGAMTEWEPRTPESTPPDLPPIRTVRFRVVVDGQPGYTRMSMAEIGPWTIMLRFSAPFASAEAADAAAHQAMIDAVRQVLRGSAA